MKNSFDFIFSSMKLRELRQLIREELIHILYEAKCPHCGDPNAYQGFMSVECPNKKCRAYSAKQEQEISKNVKSSVKAVDSIRSLYGRVKDCCDVWFEQHEDYFLDDFKLSAAKIIDSHPSCCEYYSDGPNGNGYYANSPYLLISDEKGSFDIIPGIDNKVYVLSNSKYIQLNPEQLDKINHIDDIYKLF